MRQPGGSKRGVKCQHPAFDFKVVVHAGHSRCKPCSRCRIAFSGERTYFAGKRDMPSLFSILTRLASILQIPSAAADSKNQISKGVLQQVQTVGFIDRLGFGFFVWNFIYCQPIATSFFFGAAGTFLASDSFRSPSSYFARMSSTFAFSGSVNERLNELYENSRRV